MTKEEKELDKKIKTAGLATAITGGSMVGLSEFHDFLAKNDPEMKKTLESSRKLRHIGIASGIAGGGLLGYRAYRHHKDKNKNQSPTN